MTAGLTPAVRPTFVWRPSSGCVVDPSAGLCVARVCDANPLAPIEPMQPSDLPVIRWSGWIADEASPADPSLRTWLGEGWLHLLAWLERRESQGPGDLAPLWLRPHHGHVLSDVPSIGRWIKTLPQHVVDSKAEYQNVPPRIGLVIDPAALLAPAMLADAADHVQRMIDAFAGMPLVRCWWLAGTTPAPATGLQPQTIAQLPAELRDLVLAHLPRHVPVVSAESA